MPVSRTVAARELGAELRALRQARGFTLRNLEKLAGISNATISMWENGHRLPAETSVETLCDALGAPTDKRDRLTALIRSANGPGHVAPGVPSDGDQLAELISNERTATRITDLAPLLIPGLLQTSDYSRAILGDDTSATLRVGRREILTKRNAVEYVALIDSEVLVRPIGSAEVMRDQLDHLVTIGALPNVHIHLWHSTRPGWHPGLTGPFVILEFAAREPIVHLEHHRSSLFLWDSLDVREYMDAAEMVRREVSLTEQESAEVIATIAHGMETA